MTPQFIRLTTHPLGDSFIVTHQVDADDHAILRRAMRATELVCTKVRNTYLIVEGLPSMRLE